MKKDVEFMMMALEEAKLAFQENEIPVGCVLVCNDEVISSAHNSREKENTVLGHAEINAIKIAEKKLGTRRLNNCVLYVTLEPCPMCAGIIQQSQIQRIVFGAKDEKMGACGGLYDLFLIPRLNHYPFLTSGVMEKECSNLIKEYFKKNRQK